MITVHSSFQDHARAAVENVLGEATVLFTAARDSLGGSGDITVAAAELESAAETIRRFQAAGWLIEVDPGGYAAEGYVEFGATRRFVSAEAAEDEALALGAKGRTLAWTPAGSDEAGSDDSFEIGEPRARLGGRLG